MSLRPFANAASALASSSSNVGVVTRTCRPLAVLGKRTFTSFGSKFTIYPTKSISSSIARPHSFPRCPRRFTTSSKVLNGTEGGEGGIAITELTTTQYEDISERDMEILNESLEYLCEDLGKGDWEVEYSSGVLNLSLPPHGHYVVNKQPPNQQIWISSPISGPSRFGYSASPDVDGEEKGTWVHHRREGVTLGGLLDNELRGIMKESGIEGEWQGTGLK